MGPKPQFLPDDPPVTALTPVSLSRFSLSMLYVCFLPLVSPARYCRFPVSISLVTSLLLFLIHQCFSLSLSSLVIAGAICQLSFFFFCFYLLFSLYIFLSLYSVLFILLFQCIFLIFSSLPSSLFIGFSFVRIVPTWLISFSIVHVVSSY